MVKSRRLRKSGGKKRSTHVRRHKKSRSTRRRHNRHRKNRSLRGGYTDCYDRYGNRDNENGKYEKINGEYISSSNCPDLELLALRKRVEDNEKEFAARKNPSYNFTGAPVKTTSWGERRYGEDSPPEYNPISSSFASQSDSVYSAPSISSVTVTSTKPPYPPFGQWPDWKKAYKEKNDAEDKIKEIKKDFRRRGYYNKGEKEELESLEMNLPELISEYKRISKEQDERNKTYTSKEKEGKNVI